MSLVCGTWDQNPKLDDVFFFYFFFLFSFFNSNYSWDSRTDLIVIQTLEPKIHKYIPWLGTNRWWDILEYCSSINESGLSINSGSWGVEVLFTLLSYVL